MHWIDEYFVCPGYSCRYSRNPIGDCVTIYVQSHCATLHTCKYWMMTLKQKQVATRDDESNMSINLHRSFCIYVCVCISVPVKIGGKVTSPTHTHNWLFNTPALTFFPSLWRLTSDRHLVNVFHLVNILVLLLLLLLITFVHFVSPHLLTWWHKMKCKTTASFAHKLYSRLLADLLGDLLSLFLLYKDKCHPGAHLNWHSNTLYCQVNRHLVASTRLSPLAVRSLWREKWKTTLVQETKRGERRVSGKGSVKKEKVKDERGKNGHQKKSSEVAKKEQEIERDREQRKKDKIKKKKRNSRRFFVDRSMERLVTRKTQGEWVKLLANHLDSSQVMPLEGGGCVWSTARTHVSFVIELFDNLVAFTWHFLPFIVRGSGRNKRIKVILEGVSSLLLKQCTRLNHLSAAVCQSELRWSYTWQLNEKVWRWTGVLFWWETK